MTTVLPVFTEYEHKVIREMARHQAHPDAVRRFLEAIGKPASQLLKAGRRSQNAALRGLSEQVQGWIEDGLIKTFRAANILSNTNDILKRHAARGIKLNDIDSLRYLPLSRLDAVADSLAFGSRFLLAVEGAVMGGATTMAEGIPGAQLVIPSLILTDVASSMTLLSRQTCLIATAYGYSSKIPDNLPHLVAAMAPQSQARDEGYLALKTAVVTSISESGQFLTRTSALVIDRELLEREAPQMIRLIAYVADRLGVVITQKEIGILLPVAGAVLNSAINVAFQHVTHQTAKNYFRRLILEDRYGEQLVAYAMDREITATRNSA